MQIKEKNDEISKFQSTSHIHTGNIIRLVSKNSFGNLLLWCQYKDMQRYPHFFQYVIIEEIDALQKAWGLMRGISKKNIDINKNNFEVLDLLFMRSLSHSDTYEKWKW